MAFIFFVVHLNPHNYLKRQVEAKVVANKIGKHQFGRKAIVLGDFNAHSEVDSEILNKQNFLIEKWQKKEKEKKVLDSSIHRVKSIFQ